MSIRNEFVRQWHCKWTLGGIYCKNINPIQGDCCNCTVEDKDYIKYLLAHTYSKTEVDRVVAELLKRPHIELTYGDRILNELKQFLEKLGKE